MKRNLIFLWLLMVFPVFAQQPKEEREEGIRRDEMPKPVIDYLVKNMPSEARKIRNYRETDGAKKSFETKFKIKRRKYSVEFSDSGNLEDIEVEVREKELAEPVAKNIQNYLKYENDRYKIEKIEAQYQLLSGKTMQRALQPFKNKPDFFELIVATRNDGELEKYEITFDKNGNFVKQRKVNRLSYDYLLF